LAALKLARPAAFLESAQDFAFAAALSEAAPQSAETVPILAVRQYFHLLRLRSSVPAVRQRALDRLKQFRSPSCLKAFIAALDDTDELVRKEAEIALDAFLGRLFSYPLVILPTAGTEAYRSIADTATATAALDRIPWIANSRRYRPLKTAGNALLRTDPIAWTRLSHLCPPKLQRLTDHILPHLLQGGTCINPLGYHRQYTNECRLEDAAVAALVALGPVILPRLIRAKLGALCGILRSIAGQASVSVLLQHYRIAGSLLDVTRALQQEGPTVCKPLLAALESQSDVYGLLSAAVLGHFEYIPAAPAIRKLVISHKGYGRDIAIEALARTDARACLDLVCTAVSDVDKDVRLVALKAALAVGSAEWLGTAHGRETIEKAMADTEEEVRLTAIRVLLKSGTCELLTSEPIAYSDAIRTVNPILVGQ
jgi:hypothetical protein